MFLDRSSLASAEQCRAMIGERLKLPVPVLFFPEGTSTDGTMLRFHSRLFEPAIVRRSAGYGGIDSLCDQRWHAGAGTVLVWR